MYLAATVLTLYWFFGLGGLLCFRLGGWGSSPLLKDCPLCGYAYKEENQEDGMLNDPDHHLLLRYRGRFYQKASEHKVAGT